MALPRREVLAEGIEPSEIAERALEIGKAAEHLVCADLILLGYRAFLADQGLPYDVIVDYNGRLMRVQVKSTLYARPLPQRKRHPGAIGYLFYPRRRGHKARVKASNEFDLLALVAIDIRQVAYMPLNKNTHQCIFLRPPGVIPKKYGGTLIRNIDQYPFDRALEELDANSS